RTQESRARYRRTRGPGSRILRFAKFRNDTQRAVKADCRLRTPGDEPHAVLFELDALEVDVVDVDAPEPVAAATRLALSLGHGRRQVAHRERHAVRRPVLHDLLVVLPAHAD